MKRYRIIALVGVALLMLPCILAGCGESGNRVEYKGVSYIEPQGWNLEERDGARYYRPQGSETGLQIYIASEEYDRCTKSQMESFIDEFIKNAFGDSSDITRIVTSATDNKIVTKVHDPSPEQLHPSDALLVSLPERIVGIAYGDEEGDRYADVFAKLCDSVLVVDTTQPIEEASDDDLDDEYDDEDEEDEDEDLPTTYEEDVYEVGEDIPAGEYMLEADAPYYHGYYAVYPNVKKKRIVGNANFSEIYYVTVKKGQCLELVGCTAVAAKEADRNISKSIEGNGLFKVGTDIKPGKYKLKADSSSGYYCIYGSSSPDAGILENNLFKKSDYCTVSKGQYLEITGCTASKK